jgi:hypothetical protein
MLQITNRCRNYVELFVPRVRVELTSEVFQTPAVTTLAILADSRNHYTMSLVLPQAYYVRPDGIEPSTSTL